MDLIEEETPAGAAVFRRLRISDTVLEYSRARFRRSACKHTRKTVYYLMLVSSSSSSVIESEREHVPR